jgi:arylsulfatase A-like enzyme
MTRLDGLPGYMGYLNRNCVTIAEVLKTAGYTTLMTGKWHVGHQDGQRPLQRGFERYYGIPQGGGVYYWPDRRDRSVYLDDSVIQVNRETFYSTVEFNEYAVRFIEEHVRNNSKPFFLYLAHIAPHFPLQADPRVVEKYRGRYMEGFQALRQQRFEYLLEKGILAPETSLSDFDKRVLEWDKLTAGQRDTFDLRMSVYAAQMDIMDQGIGLLLDKLEELGIMDNTVIFFLSDNGGTNEDLYPLDNSNEVPIGSPDSWTSYRASWANVSNTPFRLYKHWVHEGGISTPLIIHYPAMIKSGRLDSQVGHIIDLMPTCLDLARASYPTTCEGNNILPMEGKSLLPVMEGEQREGHAMLFWEHEGNRAVRKGKWKAVSAYGDPGWSLYNMEADRSESEDMKQAYPDTLDLMVGIYEDWAGRVGAIPYDSLLSHREQFMKRRRR